MRNFMSNIDEEDLLNSRDNRNSTINRPDIDPGMDEEEDDWGSVGDSDSFGDSGWSSSFGNKDSSESPFGGSSFGGSSFGGSSFGGSSFGGFSQQYGSPQNNQNNMNNPQSTLPEDKFWGTIMTGGKGSINFLKEIYNSFKTFDTVKKMKLGRNVLLTSVGLLGLSSILWIFKVCNISSIVIASFLSMGISTPLFMTMLARLEKEKELDLNTEVTYNSDFENSDLEDSEHDFKEEEDSWNNNFTEDEEESNEKENNIWDLEDEDTEDKELFTSSKTFDYSEDLEEEKVNPLEVLDRLNSDSYGMSRQYLFEAITACMINKKKNFYDTIEIEEDSKEFLAFCTMIEKASNVVASKSADEEIQLLSAKDKLFYTLLEIERPSWLDANALKKLIDEIVNICSFDPKTFKKDPNIFGFGDVVGDKAYIKIMKGETALVTVKDAFAVVKDEILNTKNKMPVVIGIDAEGEVIWQDFKEVHSMLVTGQPRSGKSWTVLSLISQLMMFCTPSDVNFICCDPKNRTSDFYSLTVPHIKKFVSTDEDIVKTLRWVVREEATRREKILFDVGPYKDIKDLHKEHPEVELPYLYVVIDEVITLAERMDKETKEEFQSYLLELVTRLPSYGIRIIMVPHMVKNDIIKKSTTDSIPIRINVRGDAKAIENITGAKEKEFGYKLSHMGDMAVKLDSGVMFIHSTVLSDTNNGIEEVFTFLTNLWLKLQPESFKGSKLEKDIKAGIRKISDFPGLANIDLSYLEEEKELKNSKRPKRSSVVISENEKVVTNKVNSNLDNNVCLDSDIQKELLNGIHDDIRPQSKNKHKISYDDNE